MPRSKGKAGDFHNGLDHERIRGPEEDVRLSADGRRGPGFSARRVKNATAAEEPAGIDVRVKEDSSENQDS